MNVNLQTKGGFITLKTAQYVLLVKLTNEKFTIQLVSMLGRINLETSSLRHYSYTSYSYT